MQANATEALASVIEKHKAALAAADAVSADKNLYWERRDIAQEALEKLVVTPCADDGEFLQRLKYLSDYLRPELEGWGVEGLLMFTQLVDLHFASRGGA